MAEWHTSNLVVTVDLGVRLPLNRIASEFENVTYDPEQFPGLTLKFGEGKPTILVYSTGRLVVTGAKNIKESIEAANEFRRMLKEKLNVDTPEKFTYKIQNYVVNGKFKYNNIDINKLAEEEADATYNPEQFPGVSVKFNTEYGEVTFLVFKTGNFVCTGAKSDEQVEKSIKLFEEKLAKYAKE